MAFGVKRMARQSAIVRKLPAVEWNLLTQSQLFCADKTGTLTEGIMKAQEIWVAGETYIVTGQGTSPEGSLSTDGQELSNPDTYPEPLKQALKVLALCNNATIQKAEMEQE